METIEKYKVSAPSFQVRARRSIFPQEFIGMSNSYRRDVNNYGEDEANLDIEMICARIAGDSLIFPSLKSELVEIYQKSPEKYYLCAVRTKGYNSSLITSHAISQSLSREASARSVAQICVTRKPSRQNIRTNTLPNSITDNDDWRKDNGKNRD